MAQHVVSGAAGVIGGNTNIDVDAALSSMQAGLDAMEIPELLLLVMETSLVSLCMKIMSVLITVILYGRMIEIYLYCSVSPIPFATMTNREWADRQQLLKSPVRPRFSRLPHNDMRRHLCGFGWQHDCSGQPAQRDFLPCSLHRDFVLLFIQNRRTCEVNL